MNEKKKIPILTIIPSHMESAFVPILFADFITQKSDYAINETIEHERKQACNDFEELALGILLMVAPDLK